MFDLNVANHGDQDIVQSWVFSSNQCLKRVAPNCWTGHGGRGARGDRKSGKGRSASDANEHSLQGTWGSGTALDRR